MPDPDLDVSNIPDRAPDSPEELARKEAAQEAESIRVDPVAAKGRMEFLTVEDCKRFGIVGEVGDKHWVVTPYKVDANHRVIICYYHEWGERETGEVDDDNRPLIGTGLFAEMVKHGENRYQELLDQLELL